ncbi:23S rRNA (adenine(2503)-C(2))-methyltransferase RlmN [Desulforegula conservatrix]|uniref:23S rRNA (adenine(2503)-C(2))-methyltransferase RlmN n=1 Tax=Desulforegula conservatrix TaxID=153026 RepID=UPI000414305B|nr:23S rRNA (adenine(2503)-C(2))-methyltransferase RlmN [Desulforegula conservatrix]
MKQDIKNLSMQEMRDWLKETGLEPYRSTQIFKWLYLRLVSDFSEMTDLSKDLRTKLAEKFVIGALKTIETAESTDGTKKYLFQLEDGNYIESVLIPGKDRSTLCISSQVGCAQGCRFCMTAKAGFIRNLTQSEITDQIVEVRREIIKSDCPDDLDLKNIVFMGMGEPLANLENVSKALEIITNGDCGLKLSHRRVTVSTCGLVPKFQDLAKMTRANLAISLNATDDDTRDMLMPINKSFPLKTLIDACKRYPLDPRQKITFEYILIRDLNDSMADARRITSLLHGVKAKINLIPYNESPGSEFKRPDDSRINGFLQFLLDKGYTAIIRKSKGADIAAACGQLSANARSRQERLEEE